MRTTLVMLALVSASCTPASEPVATTAVPNTPASATPAKAQRVCFRHEPALLIQEVQLDIDAKGAVTGSGARIDIDEEHDKRVTTPWLISGVRNGEHFTLSVKHGAEPAVAEQWRWSGGDELVLPNDVLNRVPCATSAASP